MIARPVMMTHDAAPVLQPSKMPVNADTADEYDDGLRQHH
jgi:hypothetical protein